MKYQKQAPKRNPRQRPESGEFVVLDIGDRHSAHLGAAQVLPYDITRIIAAADSGDTVELCKLASYIEDKNWDIQTGMETRRNALLGCDWTVKPGDDTPRGKEIAERFEKTLQDAGALNGYDTFTDLRSDLMGAVISPFAASEIIWENSDIVGFRSIEGRHFTFQYGYTPRLITLDAPTGLELPPNKFIFHHRRRGGGDIARGGLIRVLAWLHVFQNFPFKDWLKFVERFGMPFVVARVNRNSYKEDRDVIHATIRAFGPSGGGVFDRDTEVQLLQAAAGGGEAAYKPLVEYAGQAITKLLQGQLATSGDGGGLSKNDAQSQVRRDLLEADAESISAVITQQLAAPWTAFNYGDGAPVPRLEINAAEPEDEKAKAEVRHLDAQAIQVLQTAGWQIKDPVVLEEKFGVKFQRAAGDAPATSETPAPATDTAVIDETINLKQKYEAMGMAIRAGLLTASPEIEEQTRQELGLPPISEAVRKAWAATGGIRQPITLKSSEAEAVSDALNVKTDAAAMSADQKIARAEAIVAAIESGLIYQTPGVNRALSAMLGVPEDAISLTADPLKKKLDESEPEPDALTEWLGPIERELAALAGEDLPAGEFAKRLDALAAGDGFGSSQGFETQVNNTVFTGIAAGIVAGYKRGNAKK